MIASLRMRSVLGADLAPTAYHVTCNLNINKLANGVFINV
jgi:hypothetical protein